MVTGSIGWICLAFIVSPSMAVFYFPPTIYQICGRPLVNTTVPRQTHAEIQSPSFPLGYRGTHDCSLTIALPELSWIGFYTLQFALPQSAKGCRDKLTIRTEGSPESLVTYCGTMAQHQIVFYESSLDAEENVVIRFEAGGNLEENTTDHKFVVQYTVADVVYPGLNHNHSKPVVLNGHGYIVSHSEFGSKEEHYDPNISSFFTLTELEPNMFVELYFITIQLYESDPCADKLTISGVSASPSNNDPLVLCGATANNTAFEVVTLGNSITFHFKTDGLGGSQGFHMQYDVKGYWNPQGSSAEYPEDSGVTTPSTTRETRKTSETSETSSVSVDHITTTTTKNPKYLYLGFGLGAGNLAIVILAIIGVVCFIKRRRRRKISRDSKRVGFTDSARSGPLPSPTGYQYENRSKGYGMSAAEMKDDESAYYSEIGSDHKRPEREDPDMHYASRNICDTNFYHVVEEKNRAAPPVPPTSSVARPPTGPVLKPPTLHQERDFHLPYMNPRQESRFTYTKNNERLNAVRIEYQPQTWQNNHGLQRF